MDDNIHVDITPHKSLIQKLGLVGYRTEQAVAELLDNSIDARISDEKETVEVRLDFQDKRIEVRDNGHGMDRQDLANAMIIAKGAKTSGGLGQFGIGMKSACSALGKKFAITTSKVDSNKEHRAEYDEKKWLSDDAQSWKNFSIAEKTLTGGEDWHGTKITISELNVPLYPNQVSKFKDSFGIRYFPYLNSEQISIRINSVFCKPERPDIAEGSKKEIQIKMGFGKKIHGYVALLKKRSIKGHYGIHLFKNGRLIKAYEKFGFAAHPENAKMVGELSLDHVPVNFNKSAFIEESPEYEKATDAFRSSPEFKQTMQSSRSKSESAVSVESVFGYFAKESAAHHLERSVRSKASQELLDGAKPFEMKIGHNLIEIGIKSLRDRPLYIIEKQNSGIKVTINKDGKAFRFVKNPLFLIATIASEVKLLGENPDIKKLLEKRNRDVDEFLNAWSEKSDKKETFRDREVAVPRLPNYKLADELVDVHDYVKENFGFKFQFTSLSTLTPYLHNLLGKLVYTIYTEPEKGECLSESLGEKYGKKFTVVHTPDKKTLNMLLKVSTAERIIAVREYAVIRGSTIAAPEKAFLDLVNETHGHAGQLDDSELRRMYATMKRSNLIDLEKLQTYARFMKKSDLLERVLGDEL